MKKYGTVILEGGIYASGIAGLSFLKKNTGQFQDKRVIVFCDGASPYDEKAFQQIAARNLKGSLSDLPCFCFRGGLDMDAMSFMDRSLCKMLRKAAEKRNRRIVMSWIRYCWKRKTENATGPTGRISRQFLKP